MASFIRGSGFEPNRLHLLTVTETTYVLCERGFWEVDEARDPAYRFEWIFACVMLGQSDGVSILLSVDRKDAILRRSRRLMFAIG